MGCPAPHSSTPRGHHQHRDGYTRREFRKEAWTAYSQASSRCLFLCLWQVSEWFSRLSIQDKKNLFSVFVSVIFCNPGVLSVQLYTDCGPHSWGGESVDCSAHCGDGWGRSTLRCTQTRSETQSVMIGLFPVLLILCESHKGKLISNPHRKKCRAEEADLPSSFFVYEYKGYI